MKNPIQTGFIYYDKKAKEHVFVTKVKHGKNPFFSDVDYYYLSRPFLIRTTPYGICYSDFREIK